MKRGRSSVDDDDDDDSSEFEEFAESEEEKDVDKLGYQEIRNKLKQRGIANPKGKKAELLKQLKELMKESEAVSSLKMKENHRSESFVATWTFGLTDDIMLKFVLPKLDADDVCAFSATCKAAYVLSNKDDLWKTLYEAKFGEEHEITQKTIKKMETQVFVKLTLPPPCTWKVKYALSLNESECLQCGKIYYEPLNNSKACKYHPEAFAPKNEWVRDGEDMYWRCCRQEDENDQGCTSGPHDDQNSVPGVQYDYFY